MRRAVELFPACRLHDDELLRLDSLGRVDWPEESEVARIAARAPPDFDCDAPHVDRRSGMHADRALTVPLTLAAMKRALRRLERPVGAIACGPHDRAAHLGSDCGGYHSGADGGCGSARRTSGGAARVERIT